MTLPGGFGELDWSDWVRGLVAAFVTGGASAVASGVVVSVGDPKDYAMGSRKFFVLVGTVFLMSGSMNMFAFLRTNPIPTVKKVVTTTETITQLQHPTATQVTTVQETEIKPVKPS